MLQALVVSGRRSEFFYHPSGRIGSYHSLSQTDKAKVSIFFDDVKCSGKLFSGVAGLQVWQHTKKERKTPFPLPFNLNLNYEKSDDFSTTKVRQNITHTKKTWIMPPYLTLFNTNKYATILRKYNCRSQIRAFGKKTLILPRIFYKTIIV